MKKVWLSANTMHGLMVERAEDVDQKNTVKVRDFLDMIGTSFDGTVYALFDVGSATELTSEYYTANNDIAADLERFSF